MNTDVQFFLPRTKSGKEKGKNHGVTKCSFAFVFSECDRNKDKILKTKSSMQKWYNNKGKQCFNHALPLRGILRNKETND